MASEKAPRKKASAWLRRLTNDGPRDRAELLEAMRSAARGGVIDADATAMMQGVLRVADL
jgi:Mg2+/Co2+ transporter CorC